MAGSSMKDIKLRIKSIQSTRQITKAMQLVASSKLRRAKERMELAAPYFNTFGDIINNIANSSDVNDSIYFEQKEAKKICHCVIAGDRGLAGGYNTNVFKEVIRLAGESDAETVIFPIGKKTVEHLKKHFSFADESYTEASNISIGDCFNIGKILADKFEAGEFDELLITHTFYKNALRQEVDTVKILPFDTIDGRKTQVDFENSASVTLKQTVPLYIASVIYNAVAQSYVCELTSRQNAMDTATSNADEMLSSLQLQYNRARQAGITQEITEIVAGANS